MTPIEQAKEALQEVSDTMDRKGGVAPIIRLDTLKKVNAALALLKTMEGDPVMWMSSTGMTLSHSEYKMWRDTTDERGPGYMKTFTIPLYASTHTKTITVDEILELVKENDMDAEGDESFTNESHWANLHNRLTSKFK